MYQAVVDSHEEPADPVQVDRNRAAYMEALYQRSGRTERNHPLHGRLTGLHEEFCLLIGRQVVADLVARYPGGLATTEIHLEVSHELRDQEEAG
jgi:hypothetical protein